jgi:hypothetical protein
MPPEAIFSALTAAIIGMAGFIVTAFWYIVKRQDREIQQWQENSKEQGRISSAALTIAERNQDAIEALDGRVQRVENAMEGLPARVASAVKRALSKGKGTA